MTDQEDAIIEQALLILERRLKARAVFSDLDDVKNFLRLQSHGFPEKIFAVMYLDCELRLIEYERQTSVDPQNIARKALIANAAAVILHHNHAEGCCWPSLSDYEDAMKAEDALGLFGLPLLDHVITSGDGMFSMLEHSRTTLSSKPPQVLKRLQTQFT